MKYQGNKNRIVNDILPIILKNRKPGQWYVEPFCGSCSVIQRVTGNRIASDKNKYLIAMWKALTEGKEMPQYITKEFYDDVRDCFHGRNNNYTDDIIGWVGYMGSFNGRFFDGGYSGHNVVGKNGKTRDYIAENIANTMRQVEYLKGVVWESGDYFSISIPDNSLIYCDPPYRNTKEYQFSRGFDFEAFYSWCEEMTKKGHTVIISEYAMPENFECIWSKKLTNAMNPTITKNAVERLFIPKSSIERFSNPEMELDFDEKVTGNELTDTYNDMMTRMDNLYKDEDENGI